MMKNFKLENDITLYCVKAESFPTGINSTHEKLASLTENIKQKKYFGVSYSYDNEILYMGAVQTNQQNAMQILSSCTIFTLKKGNYISIEIKDFAKDIPLIGKAFNTLLNDPKIDPEGCCVECYLPEGSTPALAKDVRCMVRLAD